MNPNNHHVVFAGIDCLFKAIVQISRHKFSESENIDKLPQRNAQHFSIFLMTKGELSWHYDGKIRTLRGNSIFFGIPHTTLFSKHQIIQPCELYVLRLDTTHPLFRNQIGTLVERIFSYQNFIYPANYACTHALERILQEHSMPDANSQKACQWLIHLLLIEFHRLIHQAHRIPQNELLNSHSEIYKVIQSLINEPEKNLTITDMARISGFSEAHFQKKFRELMGVSANDYKNRKRVDRAKMMLDQGSTITQTAHTLGFSSSQYFATVFKKYTGYSPSYYKKSVLIDDL